MERHREFASVLDEVAKESSIEHLKPKQREAMETFVAGRDLLNSGPPYRLWQIYYIRNNANVI